MLARTVRHLLFLLLVPVAVAGASELTLKTNADAEGGYPTIWYGLAPANGYFGVLGLRLDGELIEPAITGTVAFGSGPLLSLDVEPGDDAFSPDVSTYSYAPGTFTMEVAWTDDTGVTRHGRYMAPLLALEVVTCEGCETDPLSENPQSYGEFTALLGDGLFDRRLAAVLGVARRAQAGTFSGDLDQISGTPATIERFAGAPGGWAVAVDVSRAPAPLPEPGVGALLTVGALVTWLAKAGRRSA